MKNHIFQTTKLYVSFPLLCYKQEKIKRINITVICEHCRNIFLCSKMWRQVQTVKTTLRNLLSYMNRIFLF